LLLYLLYRKIQEKRYDDIVKENMYALLTAESKDIIDQLFNNIQTIEESASGKLNNNSFI